MKTAELLFQQNFVELVENNIKTLRCFHVYQIGCYIFCLIFFFGYHRQSPNNRFPWKRKCANVKHKTRQLKYNTHILSHSGRRKRAESSIFMHGPII